MMETEYHVPTPKTPTKQRSLETIRDKRIKVYTLYFDTGWTHSQIALQLNLTIDQVRYALAYRLTPQKAKTRRRILLNTPQRKRLIEFVTKLRKNRRIPLDEVGTLLFSCSKQAIRTALKREGYIRAIARRKPPLSEQNKVDRLA
jgi:hypothetical protein